MFRRASAQPRWVRPALLLILVWAAVIYCWGIGGNEYSSFYASAARSMSENWKAFLFGSFSPANTITVDKIPGYLWPQALSARLFGFHSWSLVLPQIIEAVVTLLVTYRLVRRWAGEAAAVLAAGFLALTPALIAATHTNNEEAAYVMCLALAASAAQRSAVSGTVTLALTGAWAIYIAAGFPAYRDWLIPLIAVAGIAALIALALAGRRPAVTQRAVLAACAIGLIAVIAGPAAWASSVITAGDDTSLAMGNVGPNAPGAGAFGGARGAGHPGFGGGGGFRGGAGGGGPAAAGGLAGMWVSDGTLSAQQRDLLDYAQAHRDGARFVLTVTNTFQATPYILRAGADVLSMGGFSGQVPYPALAQFTQYVATGQVRYVYLPVSGGSGISGAANQAQSQSQSSQSTASQIQAWIPAHCSKVPASDYAGGTAPAASGTLYLCSG